MNVQQNPKSQQNDTSSNPISRNTNTLLRNNRRSRPPRIRIMPMSHTPIHILHRHLERLVKAAMYQTPHMANAAAERIHMLPGAGRGIPLPMLDGAADSDAQLERARGVLVGRRPVRLDHHRRRGADAAAEGLARYPAGRSGRVAGEDLHVSGRHYGDDVEDAFTGGSDVRLDECGTALEDIVGDEVFEY
jgi:hypothetical protein